MKTNFVPSAKRGHPPHNIKHEELNKWFLIWGIIGVRRQINPVIRLMPYFDRGPGSTMEKQL